MLAYWVVAGLLVLDVISIDPALMYSDYQTRWSWHGIGPFSHRCGVRRLWTDRDVRTYRPIPPVQTRSRRISSDAVRGDYGNLLLGNNKRF